MSVPLSIGAVQALLARQGYVCGRALGTVAYLALRLGRPLFLEGEAGTGKTEIAKALSQRSGVGSSACNATRGSIPRAPSTSGTSPNR